LLLRRAALGTSYVALMNVVTLGIAFTFYIAIARVLTPSEVGEISLLFMVMTVFNSLTLLALNSAVTKFVSEKLGMNKPDEASAAFWGSIKLMSKVALPAFAVTVVFSSYLARFVGGLDASLVSMAAGAGLILDYTSILGAAFYGLWLYGSVTIQNILFYVVGRFSGLALAMFGLRIHGVALGILTGAIASLAYSILVFRGKLPRTKTALPSNSLIGYSGPIYVASLIVLAQAWLDIAILYMITADLSVVGTYYLVISSTAVLTFLPNSLASVLFPTMSYKIGESGQENATDILGIVIRLSLLIITPISLALAAVAPTALTVAYGAKYSAGGTALAIAALAVVPTTIYVLINSTLQALGSTRSVALAGAVAVLANLVTLLLAVPILAGVGAALARLVMALAGLVVSYSAIRSQLGYRLKIDWRIPVFSCLSAMPALAIDRLVSLGFLAKGLVELTAFIVAAVILLKLVKPFNETEKDIIMRVIPRNLRSAVKLVLS
jgi:O-antigen/teichoic acid export membrane protein